MKALLLENISGVVKSRFIAAGFEVESLPSALNEFQLREKLQNVSVLGIPSKTNTISTGIAIHLSWKS